MQGAATVTVSGRPITAARIKRMARQAELESGTGATGLTILRFRDSTISRLVNNGKIGQIELQVIDEISRINSYLCGSLILRGHNVRERLDRGHGHEPIWFVDAYQRYLPWAQKWSQRRKAGADPSLEIVFDVIVSGKSGQDIDDERLWKHGTALTIFANAIRDYAADAGWCDRNTALRWNEMARTFFKMLRMRARSP